MYAAYVPPTHNPLSTAAAKNRVRSAFEGTFRTSIACALRNSTFLLSGCARARPSPPSDPAIRPSQPSPAIPSWPSDRLLPFLELVVPYLDSFGVNVYARGSTRESEMPRTVPQSQAAMVASQVQVRCLSGRTALVDGAGGVAELVARIAQLEGVPAELLRLTACGRQLHQGSDACADVFRGAPVAVMLRLEGGKGGFGAMLRTAGARGVKTTNFDACRDLNGRRLRHVNAEAQLREWDARAEERKLQKQQQQALNAKPGGPPAVARFDDDAYDEMLEVREPWVVPQIASPLPAHFVALPPSRFPRVTPSPLERLLLAGRAQPRERCARCRCKGSGGWRGQRGDPGRGCPSCGRCGGCRQ